MEPGQKQFYDYILSCVQTGKETEADGLLQKCFALQENKAFTREAMDIFHNRLMPILKPEYVSEVSAIMHSSGSAHINAE